MLKPETQDLALFADGMDNIVSTQRSVAQHYFNDGSIEMACPPLKALLHIMAHGQFEGRDLGHAKIRALFTRDNLLAQRLVRRAPAREASGGRKALAASRELPHQVHHQGALREKRPRALASRTVCTKRAWNSSVLALQHISTNCAARSARTRCRSAVGMASKQN